MKKRLTIPNINIKSMWLTFKSFLCIAFFIFINSEYSQGQVYNSDYGSLVDGSAATTNVNLYTGTLNINIPIKTFNARGVQLPVILRYDGSGVRINQHPTWVGQNWNLTCGGSIVRVVRNKVDEYSYLKRPSRDGNIPNEGYISSSNYFSNCSSATLKSNSLKQIADSASVKGYDFEPDEFIFNFLGYSGTFLLGNDGQWNVKSNNHIQVLFDVKNEANYCIPFSSQTPSSSSPSPKVIAGFILKTNDGTSYYFGFNNDAIEYEQPFFGSTVSNPNNVWIASSWHLTRIVDRFNNELYNLKYLRGSSTSNLYRNDGTVNPPSEVENSVTLDTYTPERSGGSKYCPLQEVHTGVVRGKLISPVYLESIYSNGSLLAKFNIDISNEKNYSGSIIANNSYYLSRDLKWMKLSSITIPSDSVNIAFSYNDSRGLVNRLCLENFSIKSYSKLAPVDANNSVFYTFSYNNFDLLPDYLSTNSDAWGYSSTPYTIDKNDLAKFERNFDFGKVKYGSLNKIFYPNGKYSIFDYEPHDYYSFVNRFKNVESNFVYGYEIASGLRVKNIYDYDGVNMNMKYYTYLTDRGTINQKSSGILYAKPRYYEKDEVTDRVYFSVNSLVPLSSTYDYFVSYSQVQENNQDESYTDYSFTNLLTNMDIAPNKVCYMPGDYDTYTSFGNQRGLLTEKRHYNTAGEMTYYSRNKYDFDSKYNLLEDHYDPVFDVKASNLKHETTCDGKLDYMGGIYYHRVFKPLLMQTVEYSINGTSSLVTEQTYTYRYFKNFPYLASISKSTKTSTEKTLYSYTFDFKIDSDMQSLTSSFIVQQPVKTIFIKNGKLSKISQTTFGNFNGKILPQNIFSYNKGGLLDKVDFISYDEVGDLVESRNINGISNFVVYGYDFKYPVIELQNIDKSKFNDYIRSKGYGLSDIQKSTSEVQLKTIVENIIDGFTTSFPQSSINCKIYNNGLNVRQYSAKNKYIDYEYDHYLRPIVLKNNDGNILKTYSYNFNSYKEYDGLYFHPQETTILVKNDCGCNKFGSKYLAIIPKTYSRSKDEYDSWVETIKSSNQVDANGAVGCNKPYAFITSELTSKRYVENDPIVKTMDIERWSNIYLKFSYDPYHKCSYKPQAPIGINLLERTDCNPYNIKIIDVYSPGAAFPYDYPFWREFGGFENRSILDNSYSQSSNLLLKSRQTYHTVENKISAVWHNGTNLVTSWFYILVPFVHSFYLRSNDLFEIQPRYFLNSKVVATFDTKPISGFKQVNFECEIPYGLFKSVNSQQEANNFAADSLSRFKGKYKHLNAYVRCDDLASNVLHFDKEGNGYTHYDSSFKLDYYDSFERVESDCAWITCGLTPKDSDITVSVKVDKNNSMSIREGYINVFTRNRDGSISVKNRIYVIQDK